MANKVPGSFRWAIGMGEVDGARHRLKADGVVDHVKRWKGFGGREFL